MKHRQSLELKELRASQRARSKEWKTGENARRRELFAKNTSPKERRAYFKDRQERWDAYRRLLADEYTSRQNEQKARIQAVIEDQAVKLKEFNASLSRQERPADELWPRNSY